MLNAQIKQIVAANPHYAGIIPVIEKEILHHDIMTVLVEQGAMQRLTFIGGTSLRMCYNSARLSEDLDFNAGFDFTPTQFAGLDVEIKQYIEKKYETDVWVSTPNANNQGNTSSWKISIEKEANRPDLPHQKMHIDVCAIPSFDIERRALINHYNLVVPTDGLLIPVQSLAETLADKFIALAYRSRRIKPRDLWDILWIKQRGVILDLSLLEKKLAARGKSKSDFLQILNTQLQKILHDSEVHSDFVAEMSRFIPSQIKQRTLDAPEYWPYLQTEIQQLAQALMKADNQPSPFDMG